VKLARGNHYKNVSYNNELQMLTFDDCGIEKDSSYSISRTGHEMKINRAQESILRYKIRV